METEPALVVASSREVIVDGHRDVGRGYTVRLPNGHEDHEKRYGTSKRDDVHCHYRSLGLRTWSFWEKVSRDFRFYIEC